MRFGNGLFGRGSCIVCGRGTDTALAFQGEAEWCLAGVVALGVPEDEAYLTLLSGWQEEGRGTQKGQVPCGTLSAVIRVCADCVEAATPNFPKPTLLYRGAELPAIVPRASMN